MGCREKYTPLGVVDEDTGDLQRNPDLPNWDLLIQPARPV
jgi:hypothetical protein